MMTPFASSKRAAGGRRTPALLFAAAVGNVAVDMETDANVEYVLAGAIEAFRRGTRGMQIHQDAYDSFRRQFAGRILTAVAEPDWRDRWRDERDYVLCFATQLGRRAARLAKNDVRTFINDRDVDDAVWKLRGTLPIAGRWCPV